MLKQVNPAEIEKKWATSPRWQGITRTYTAKDVTYDANGFYGHPDHIQAHRVTRRAHELAGGRAKFYATAVPRSVLARAVELPEDSWFMRTTDLSAIAGRRP